MTSILVIEDNPGDAKLIETLLREPGAADAGTYQLQHVDRIAAAIKLLSQSGKGQAGAPHIDVIISDIALPDSQGTQSFQKLRQVAADLPVIFCTGTHDEEMALAALQKGAQDYLLKGQFDGETLRRSIRYAIERKKFQSEVEVIRRRARRLRERTTLLQKESAQLMELNRAKDDFISLASHQLRTPATGVKQYLGLLLEGYAGELNNQQMEFLRLAYDSNERQLKIVSDLLRTAQLDAGHVNLQFSTVDLEKLIREVVEEQSVRVRARDQSVSLDLPAGLQVEADAGKLRMALENLVDNASKYTPQGKAISLAASLQGKEIEIQVCDEGVGIDKSDQQKIFAKFSRVSNSLSDQVGGSGLGLYWVRQIITLHGGSISVTSAKGSGTCFTIRLPHTPQKDKA